MTLTVNIVTPESSIEPHLTDRVVVPAFDGELAILNGHAPFVGLLGVGSLRLRSDEHADVDYAVRGGVVQVADNQVRILAEAVAEANEIDQEHLLRRLKELDAAAYPDRLHLDEARAEALWLLVQLRTAKADLPELQQVG
ncbi:MAG: ATP synthase F1 subunit epsilon [Planctomycetota bacterium]|jgi:F-type H+-transporting ATPase subunit epsilon